MPIKLILLGVLVVGVTIGVVARNASGRGTGGCAALDNIAGLQTDSAADAAAGDSNTETASAGDNSDSAGGTDQTGSDGMTDDSTGGGDQSGAGTDDGSGDSGTDSGGSNNGDSSGDGNGDAGGDTGGGTDGGDDGGTDSGPAAIVGQYRGSLTLTTVQSLGEAPAAPRVTTLNESITFDDGGRPAGVTILNYSGNPNLRTTKRQVGEEETLTTTFQGSQITLVVHVSEAFYTSTTARLRYTLTFSGEGGSLRQSGTGTQVVNAALDADGNLSYTVDTDYAVRLIAGSINLETSETKDAVGTLPRQAATGDGADGT